MFFCLIFFLGCCNMYNNKIKCDDILALAILANTASCLFVCDTISLYNETEFIPRNDIVDLCLKTNSVLILGIDIILAIHSCGY